MQTGKICGHSGHHLLFLPFIHLLPLPLVSLLHSLPGPLAAEALANIIVLLPSLLLIRVILIIPEAEVALLALALCRLFPLLVNMLHHQQLRIIPYIVQQLVHVVLDHYLRVEQPAVPVYLPLDVMCLRAVTVYLDQLLALLPLVVDRSIYVLFNLTIGNVRPHHLDPDPILLVPPGLAVGQYYLRLPAHHQLHPQRLLMRLPLHGHLLVVHHVDAVGLRVLEGSAIDPAEHSLVQVHALHIIEVEDGVLYVADALEVAYLDAAAHILLGLAILDNHVAEILAVIDIVHCR